MTPSPDWFDQNKRKSANPMAADKPLTETGQPGAVAYSLLPGAGQPQAQSRWTRTPVYFGQTPDVPEPFTAYSEYDRNLITVNPGLESPATPYSQSELRHESIHFLLTDSLKPDQYRAITSDPTVKPLAGQILGYMRRNGYRGESETEVPAYMAVFSNQPGEWTKGIPGDLRNRYLQAFTAALQKQHPEAAGKFRRMMAGPESGRGADLAGFVPNQATGLRVPGTITSLFDRPILKNPDGTYSTTDSVSFGSDQGEVLVPRVVNGQRLTDRQAWERYRRTGEHLGIFDNPAAADLYAQRLHVEQARRQPEPDWFAQNRRSAADGPQIVLPEDAPPSAPPPPMGVTLYRKQPPGPRFAAPGTGPLDVYTTRAPGRPGVAFPATTGYTQRTAPPPLRDTWK